MIEGDRERRLRLISQRDVPDHTGGGLAGAALNELAGLVASQSELSRRFDDWLAAASASERKLNTRLAGIEDFGRRAAAQNRRDASEVAERLHAVLADERIRRGEHTRMIEDCGRQIARLETARAAVERAAAYQSRWVALACASTGATFTLALALGLRLGGF